MALTVEITGGGDIEQGAQSTLTAVVTDANGNTLSSGLQYAWSASRGSFVGATDAATVVYHADFTDPADVDITIACNVTQPANPTPTISGASLTALSELGITGILVNMFMTALGAVSDPSNNVIFNASTGTLDPGSDTQLSSTLNIFQLRWDNVGDDNDFILNSDVGGDLGAFWQGNTAQSVFLIFSDGTYHELPGSVLESSSARVARFNVADANIVSKLDGLQTTSDLVVGVGNTGSIGFSEDSGSDTETFTAAVPAPRSIAMVAMQNIVIDTDYCLTVAITGNPTTVEVTGDMEYFNYDWRPDDNEVKIAGHPEKLLNDKNWHIEATYSSGDPLERDITFNVVPAAPVFGTLPDLHLYKGVDINIEIPITNPPSEVIAETLLLGLGLEKIETGAKIDGVIPADANFTVTAGDIEIEAPHLGETVMSSFPYTIEAGAPAAIGQIKLTPKGNFAVAEFTDVQHAIEYEWGIDEGAGVDFISWNRFGPNRPGIDLENISVTLGHLSATVTFPHVAGAMRYEYLHAGNWHEFVAAPVNNMIQTIIPDLEDGETYTVYFRVSSPWMGTPVPVTIRGGRLAYVVHEGGANSVLFIFNTNVERDAVAVAEKRILLPTGNENPNGIAIDGSTAYCLDSVDRRIYVFSTDTDNGNRAVLIKSIVLPVTTGSVWSIAIYENVLYVYHPHAFNSVGYQIYTIDPNTGNGQTATVINRFSLRNIPVTTSTGNRIKLSVDRDHIYVLGSDNSRVHLYTYLRVPLDYGNVARVLFVRGPGSLARRSQAGLTVIGNTRYTVNHTTDKLYVDSKNTGNLADSEITNLFSLPAGCTEARGLDIPV